MFEPLEIMQMAHAKAAHASMRQSVIARNVANADTPGYRARDIEDFQTYFARHLSERARGSRAVGAGAHAPFALPEIRRIESGGALSPNGNSVSIETEMMRGVDVRHQHDMALNIYRTVSGILRTSLGR